MTGFPAAAARLADRLGTALPIVGFSHSLDVVEALSRHGALGVWGATRSTPDEIDDGLRGLRARLGDRPFGVDLVLPHGMPEHDDRAAIESGIPQGHRAFVDDLRRRHAVPDDGLPGTRTRFVRSQDSARAQVDAVLGTDVPVFALGIGSPPDVVRTAHERGRTVVSLVGAPRHAEAALRLGADVLVAQGYDAGAHTGPVGTFSLVPRVVDLAGDTPVLAAGGAATGRHLAAALALGAAGVWMGTAWLTTVENATEPVLLRKLLAAGVDDTVISRADSGKTLRQVRTGWSDAWSAADAPAPLRMPHQDVLVGDLLGDIDRHAVEPLVHGPAGQSIGYFTEVSTVADVLDGVVAEATRTLRALAP